LSIAQAAVVAMERALEISIDYVTDRKAFGQRVLDFQNTRVTPAHCRTETPIARTFADHSA